MMALVHCVNMVLKIYFTFLGTTQLVERSGYVLCLPIFKVSFSLVVCLNGWKSTYVLQYGCRMWGFFGPVFLV